MALYTVFDFPTERRMMGNMRKEYSSCTVLVNDEKGHRVAETEILYHDELRNQIEVDDIPELEVSALYECLILASPTPHAYKGRIHRRGKRKVIALFEGKESENRRDTRYKTDLPANVIGVIRHGKTYSLDAPIPGRIKDISRRGLRLSASGGALNVGEKFRVSITSMSGKKILTAEVLYSLDVPPDYSEFGCLLVSDAEGSGL
jgi:hypothetical protein